MKTRGTPSAKVKIEIDETNSGKSVTIWADSILVALVINMRWTWEEMAEWVALKVHYILFERLPLRGRNKCS